MGSLRAGFLRSGSITLALLLAVGSSAKSNEIVYSFDYRIAEHDSYGFFSQFDPSLGTLTGVSVSVSGGVYEYVNFFNTSLTDTVSFNGFVNVQIGTYAGSTDFSNSATYQLPPQGIVSPGIGSLYSPAGFDFSASYYSGLDFWIGYGFFDPLELNYNWFTYGADDPRITVLAPDALGPYLGSIEGSETITYFYLPPGTVPEPSSLMLSAMAAGMVAGAAYIKRKRGKYSYNH